jgi:hypothetical protein
MNVQIVIVLKGGLVQEVVTDRAIEVIVVDQDTEGADLESMHMIEDVQACCHDKDSVVDEDRLERIVNEYKNRIPPKEEEF